MLLLLLLPTVLGADTKGPAPPKTLRKSISSCPTLGYFFESQDLPNYPGTCYLCYCNGDGQAVCTIRDRERCEDDDSSDRTSNVEAVLRESKLHRRTRRGLMDLFFDDGKKDVMLKSMAQANEEDCKPKSSKSIGCPPKDWCTGCLVCDCDENSEWQCHVMSFCEDKTPRPKARKFKKMELNEIDTTGDKKKENLTKTIPPKKNDKRSVKYKKFNSTSTPTKKAKSSKKKSHITTTTTQPSTTTTKPAIPQISVKTLKKFIRKEELKSKNGLLVIKKYISTISPIVSPELLKYKNDSRKLAQMLYQQYEATTTASQRSHAVKREIKLEKIIKTKPKRNFELKYNARGRKPMNIKEHNDWNIKMRARQTKREQMKTISNANNFYSIQNQLMNPDEKNQIETIHKDKTKRNKGSHRKKAKVILIPRKRRNKRDVLMSTEVCTNSTVMENGTENISLVNSDHVETLGRVLTINEENTSARNNYNYTVDNTVTKKYEQEINNSGVIHESTLKYVDIITVDNHDFNKDNLTVTDKPNDTSIEVETITQNIKKDLDTLSPDLRDHLAKEICTKNNESELKNNHTLNSTASIYFTPNPSTNKNIDMETTTAIETKKDVNNADSKLSNNTNVRENMIRRVYITDIDTIITGLNKYNLQKWRKTNKTNGLIAKIYAIGENNSINKTMKSSTTDLEKMLQKISNNKTKDNSKQNRMIAIKYIKKLYSQLLSTKNNKSRLNNIAVMESICDTFGPCKISTGKIEVLNSKITELIFETKKALEVIRIIKGILQLIDGETNSTDNHINEEVEFKSYVKKINAVLTDTYKTPLTETQMTQMNHIKNNTKIFMNSIGKFAFILNDILEIIHAEKAKYHNLRKRKILIKRVSRHKGSEPLHKIKNLFLKFNVLQNSFMRNMYQAISELEMRNEQKNAMTKGQSLKYQRDTRYQTSVNKYMNKINYNLEKLKDLALKMGAKERRKRNAMDHDDAVEYLLALMEYLLKHKNPVESPPVADGIDLLIDAIRRAPDIKPIKNKALKQIFPMSAYPDINPKSKSSSESEDDSFKNKSGNLKDNLSFEKTYSNDTRIVTSNYNEFHGYRITTSEAPQTSAGKASTKYVDVEDLVFNGDVIPKVYMATIPVYEHTDDADSEKEEPKPIATKELKTNSTNESASAAEDETSILTNKTDSETDVKTENITIVATEKTFMTQFDRLNEEYEKQIKGKAPSIKSVKLQKRKKTKRLRKKQKDAKSDVSSITKEVDEENTRKKIVVEEANLRKHVASTEDDPFQLDDESVSRDISPLDAVNNEIFPSYFT